jgi:site-specific recombinase XerD
LDILCFAAAVVSAFVDLMYHLHFFVKRLKKRKGKVPVYCRITIHRERAEFATGAWVTEEAWKLGKFNPATIRTRMDALYEQQLGIGAVSSAQLRDAFKGAKPKYLLKVYATHLKEIKQLEQDYTLSTYNCYKRAFELLRTFVQSEYHTKDLPLLKVTHTFVSKFNFYLKATLKLAHNTAVKYMARLKKVIRLSIANKWMEDNPFALFKIKFNTADKQWLDIDEVKRLARKKFTIARLEKVKDVFLFCCYTGLSYSDAAKLTSKHIALISGQNWIIINRTKTDITSRIPILPQAQKILAKYNGVQDKLLPILSNQKMNAYLKEIADLCGIHKTLTVHIARHTFATTITLTNGVSIESVSKMLGHTNVKMTAHYAKIIDKKLAEEMRHLKRKLSG